MSRKKRVYEDDDGRTIADMSDISAPSLFVPRSVPTSKKAPEPQKEKRPWEDTGYSKKERLMIVLGVTKGALLIGLAYILGIGLLVGLLWLLV